MLWIHVSIPELNKTLFLFRIYNSSGDVNCLFLLNGRILGVEVTLMTIVLLWRLLS